MCGAVHFELGAIAAVVGCVKVGRDEYAVLRRVPCAVSDGHEHDQLIRCCRLRRPGRRLPRRWIHHVHHFVPAPLRGAVHFVRSAVAAVVGCVKLGSDEQPSLCRLHLAACDRHELDKL